MSISHSTNNDGITNLEDTSPYHVSVLRSERLLLLVILSAGLILRTAYLSRSTIEHFDEGVYATDLWFRADSAYPNRHLYAPPLLPKLIGVSTALFGPTPMGTMLVSLAAGVLTILVVWWVARRWFGPAAGLSAAVLAALSDFHIVFSRAALTDVLLGLWLLLAVHFIRQSFRFGGGVPIVLAGLMTGLAWWTKYNGWLPLAIGLAGLVPWLIFSKKQQPKFKLFSTWVATGLIAVIVWSPVWFGLQKYGGYAVVQNNHLQYITGLENWPQSAIRQLANLQHFDGWNGAASLLFATLLPLVFVVAVRQRFTWNAWRSADRFTWNVSSDSRQSVFELVDCKAVVFEAVAIALLLVAGATAIGTNAVIGLLAILGLGLQFRTMFAKRRAENRETSNSLEVWLVTAWFVGLLVATPLYRPYPRLVLPWLIAGWLGTAAAVDWWIKNRFHPQTVSDQTRNESGHRFACWTTILCVAVSMGVLSMFGNRLASRGVPGWQDRTGLQSVSEQIIQIATGHLENENSAFVPFIVYVYGEPAIVFHLTSNGVVAQPVGDLGFAHSANDAIQMPTFMVTGPHAGRTKQFAAEWQTHRDKFELIDSFEYFPSDLVLLNDRAAWELGKNGDRKPETVRLYRLK